jgi:hypothetical protein
MRKEENLAVDLERSGSDRWTFNFLDMKLNPSKAAKALSASALSLVVEILWRGLPLFGK